jgi:hypothetical protein
MRNDKRVVIGRLALFLHTRVVPVPNIGPDTDYAAADVSLFDGTTGIVSQIGLGPLLLHPVIHYALIIVQSNAI